MACTQIKVFISSIISAQYQVVLVKDVLMHITRTFYPTATKHLHRMKGACLILIQNVALIRGIITLFTILLGEEDK